MKQMIQKSLRILLSVLMLLQAEDDWLINSVSIDPVDRLNNLFHYLP